MEGWWSGGGGEGRGDVGSDIEMETKMAGARHINFGRFCVYRVIKSLTYVSSSVNTGSVLWRCWVSSLVVFVSTWIYIYNAYFLLLPFFPPSFFSLQFMSIQTSFLSL